MPFQAWAWFEYGSVLSELGDLEEACEALERVLRLSSGRHVTARIRLSTLQETLGKTDLALDTLHEPDAANDQVAASLKDERLLARECHLHLQQSNRKQFLAASLQLLASYFQEFSKSNIGTHLNSEHAFRMRFGSETV